MCLPRGKVSIPFPQQKGRNFDATTQNYLSLAVSETQPWKILTVNCRDRLNLDCHTILPATLCSLWRISKLLFAKIFLVIPILINWHKRGYFGWLGMDTLVKFVFVSLAPLSTVSFIIQKTFKELWWWWWRWCWCWY